MAIVIGQQLAGLYGQAAIEAGASLGRAESLQRQQAVGERRATAARQSAERIAAEKRAVENRREMAEFDNQLVIEREKRQKASKIQQEQRAMDWELEKMEIRSRLDFEYDEKQRMQKIQDYDNALKTIEENDNITEGQKDALRFAVEEKRLGVTVSSREAFPDLYGKKESAFDLLKKKLAGEEVAPPPEELSKIKDTGELLKSFGGQKPTQTQLAEVGTEQARLLAIELGYAEDEPTREEPVKLDTQIQEYMDYYNEQMDVYKSTNDSKDLPMTLTEWRREQEGPYSLWTPPFLSKTRL